MNRTEKEAVVAELTETLRNNNFVYLADTTGLSANDTNAFRRMLFNNGVTMRMAKNTLIERAMDGSGKDFGDLKAALAGTSCLLVSENQKAPAQSIKAFREKSDKPLLKGAWIDNSVFVGDNQLAALVDLKSKEDLIGDVIALLQSPARNVISALQANAGQKLAGLVKTLSERDA
ncbi:MAG: 50S ribosomal protein L10 [Bacteroidetes bacterium]|nr:50S ribosomal protein L10 [Bacteroidota bacterium]